MKKTRSLIEELELMSLLLEQNPPNNQQQNQQGNQQQAPQQIPIQQRFDPTQVTSMLINPESVVPKQNVTIPYAPQPNVQQVGQNTVLAPPNQQVENQAGGQWNNIKGALSNLATNVAGLGKTLGGMAMKGIKAIPLSALTMGGITAAGWAAMRLKLQRDLKKALDRNDLAEAQRIQQKIQSLNRLALGFGAAGIGGSLLVSKLSGATRNAMQAGTEKALSDLKNAAPKIVQQQIQTQAQNRLQQFKPQAAPQPQVQQQEAQQNEPKTQRPYIPPGGNLA